MAIPCWKCGKPSKKALTATGFRGKRFNDDVNIPRQFCSKCYSEFIKEHEETTAEYARMKKKLMLERAVRHLERQMLDLYDIKDIIDQMEEYVEERPELFDSSEEMIAAIMLVSAGIKAKPQYKIGKYKVDFFVPQLQVVLEIDGVTHKARKEKDTRRDLAIRAELGYEWEVIRIPTQFLTKNAKMLVPAISEMKAERQKLRKSHGGALPSVWF